MYLQDTVISPPTLDGCLVAVFHKLWWKLVHIIHFTLQAHGERWFRRVSIIPSNNVEEVIGDVLCIHVFSCFPCNNSILINGENKRKTRFDNCYILYSAGFSTIGIQDSQCRVKAHFTGVLNYVTAVLFKFELRRMLVHVDHVKVYHSICNFLLAISTHGLHMQNIWLHFLRVQRLIEPNVAFFINSERCVWFGDCICDWLFAAASSPDVHYSLVNSMILGEGASILILYKVKPCGSYIQYVRSRVIETTSTSVISVSKISHISLTNNIDA